MAEGDIGAVIDSLEFDTEDCQYPKIVHVTDNIYAIAYTGVTAHGWIVTVSIDPAGVIPATIEGSLKFNAAGTYYVDLIKVGDNVLAVGYKDAGNVGILKTVNISDDGKTLSLAGGPFTFEAGEAHNAHIIHVSGNVFAIAYRNANIYGRIVTVSISPLGTIEGTVLGSLNFDTTRGINPRLIHVSGHVFAVVYRGVDDDGWLKTVNISDNGATLSLTGSSLEFDIADVTKPDIIHVSGNVFAVMFTAAASDGWIRAVNISNDGATLSLTGGSLRFDENLAADIRAVKISGIVFAFSYTGPFSDGWLKTVNISDDGATLSLTGSSLEFDIADGHYPAIIHVAGNTYAIAYGGVDGDGWLKSVPIETVAISAGNPHLMLMGVG